MTDSTDSGVAEEHRVCPGCQHLNENCTCDEQDEYLTDMIEVICPDCGQEQKQPDRLDLKWQCKKCGYVAENGMGKEERVPTAALAQVINREGFRSDLIEIDETKHGELTLKDGDELVRREAVTERILSRMQDLDETDEDNWPILKELDILLCELGCEDMAYEFRKKGDTE